ncbi:CUTA, partial [Symbiodinium sp. KB8]
MTNTAIASATAAAAAAEQAYSGGGVVVGLVTGELARCAVGALARLPARSPHCTRLSPSPRRAAAPGKEAKSLARTLVDSELVACVNIVPGATSIYKWEGKIEESEESVLVIKTMGENQEAVTALVNREHSYDTPEVVFLPVVGGSE